MSDLSDHVLRFAGGELPQGEVPIAEYDQLRVTQLRLEAGDKTTLTAATETAWLLMEGSVRGHAGTTGFDLTRSSIFDDAPSCLHVCAGTEVTFEAVSECEFTVYGCSNGRAFEPRVFTPEQVPNEHRGAGQVAGRCLRFVRTIFDAANSPAEAELVLGEVVTLPGGWSSYPPHHHQQPEIYHYRFTAPQGYGHAELGDSVFKVGHRDTVCIPPGLVHAQCAAPGYGMDCRPPHSMN
jgi:5-deoxy-glucuronate isomerase